LKKTRPLWPPQRGVGLREPNLGKTNPCVLLLYSLAICFAPSLVDLIIFLTLTRLVVVINLVNFSFALFTPPLGDFHNVSEQKHCLVLNEYNSFAMKDGELVRDMYSCLNLIINELNSIGINNLGDADIVRNIISLLPQQRYGSIIAMLHNMEDLSTMTPTIVIGKIAAFEMSRKMGRQEEPTSSRPYALACDERKDKKKAPTPSSSSEEEEEEESDDEEDNQPSTSSSEDEETIRWVGKVMEMICKINLMGVPLQVEDLFFNIDGKKQRKRGCFACGEKGHFRDSCPNMAEPTKGRSKGNVLTSVKTWDDSSSEDKRPRTCNHRSSSLSSWS
jgi:hypothetical protein